MLYTVTLCDNKDFVRLYGKGVFVSCPMCTVYYRKNGGKSNRLGISTGKKIGCAVVRNRARRIIRQAYRENEKDFPRGFDIVITARPGCADNKSYNISRFFKTRVIPAMRDPAKQKRQVKNK